VLDGFADLDTCAAALSVTRLGEGGDGFDRDTLRAAVDGLRREYGFAGIVTGSGFEDRPALLDNLETLGPLLGNHAEVIRAVKDPASLFLALRELGIPHPDTRLDGDAPGSDWLLKRVGGAGGTHIRAASAGEPCPEGYYLQRRIEGTPYSALFLADGRTARIVGYNEQWMVPGTYTYGGALRVRALATRLAAEIEEAGRCLAARFELRGLCGLDFIVADDERWYAIEINPRPPATFELHETASGLFLDHVQACGGHLPAARPLSAPLRAHAVLYAATDRVIVTRAWPAWISDRPALGTRIRAGQPVCMVHAQANTPSAARALVGRRLNSIASSKHLWQRAA
jgi:predicted ATP-grasp superfamily ATP-dependent carboligase